MDNRTAHPARAWTARPAAESSVDHRSPTLTRSGGICGQVADLPDIPHFACPTSFSASDAHPPHHQVEQLDALRRNHPILRLVINAGTNDADDAKDDLLVNEVLRRLDAD